ncbi:MAG: hypothetical protein KatS3mg060_1174 [Dehalococcoidia bacterium]|nr:MAG: hypothetical protein KatS3mg060_1174 [Dehalococcoidia bacterium]
MTVAPRGEHRGTFWQTRLWLSVLDPRRRWPWRPTRPPAAARRAPDQGGPHDSR